MASFAGGRPTKCGDGKEVITKRRDCRNEAHAAAEDRRFMARWKTLSDAELGGELNELIRRIEESGRIIDELMKQCAEVCFR